MKKLIFAVMLALFALTSVAYADGVDGIWSVPDDDDEPDLFMLRENAGVYIMISLNDMAGTDWSGFIGALQDSVVHMATVVDSDAYITFDMSFITPAEGPIVNANITFRSCTPKIPNGCGDPGDWPVGQTVPATRIF